DVQISTRRPASIFHVTITPHEMIRQRTSRGISYTVIKGAKTDKARSESISVMAFGKIQDNIGSKLRPGRPVKLAVKHSNGMIEVVKLPRTARTAARA